MGAAGLVADMIRGVCWVLAYGVMLSIGIFAGMLAGPLLFGWL